MALQKASCFSNHVYTYIYIEYDFPKEIAKAEDNGLSTLQVKNWSSGYLWKSHGNPAVSTRLVCNMTYNTEFEDL